MVSDVVDRVDNNCLSSVYERIRFFDSRTIDREESMRDLRTPEDTAAAVAEPIQATDGRLIRPRKHREDADDEATGGDLLPPQRPVSPKAARVRAQPIPQARSNIKKRRDAVTEPRQPKFKRARLAKSSDGNQTEEGGRAAPNHFPNTFRSQYRQIGRQESGLWQGSLVTKRHAMAVGIEWHGRTHGSRKTVWRMRSSRSRSTGIDVCHHSSRLVGGGDFGCGQGFLWLELLRSWSNVKAPAVTLAPDPMTYQAALARDAAN